jgi:acyl carrier protein
MSNSNMQQEADMQAKPQALSDVVVWVIQHLESKHPEMKGAVHGDVSFDSVGLDSLARVDMISAMERSFGIALDATLAYDFVTPNALSAFVWGQITGEPVDQKQLMGV